MDSSVTAATAGHLGLLLLGIACFNCLQRYACAGPPALTVRSVEEQYQADISQTDMSS